MVCHNTLAIHTLETRGMVSISNYDKWILIESTLELTQTILILIIYSTPALKKLKTHPFYNWEKF